MNPVEEIRNELDAGLSKIDQLVDPLHPELLTCLAKSKASNEANGARKRLGSFHVGQKDASSRINQVVWVPVSRRLRLWKKRVQRKASPKL